MKHVWRGNIINQATTNSRECEQVYLEDFSELCEMDEEFVTTVVRPVSDVEVVA